MFMNFGLDIHVHIKNMSTPIIVCTYMHMHGDARRPSPSVIILLTPQSFSPYESNSTLPLPISGALPLECSASRFQ